MVHPTTASAFFLLLAVLGSSCCGPPPEVYLVNSSGLDIYITANSQSGHSSVLKARSTGVIDRSYGLGRGGSYEFSVYDAKSETLLKKYSLTGSEFDDRWTGGALVLEYPLLATQELDTY